MESLAISVQVNSFEHWVIRESLVGFRVVSIWVEVRRNRGGVHPFQFVQVPRKGFLQQRALELSQILEINRKLRRSSHLDPHNIVSHVSSLFGNFFLLHSKFFLFPFPLLTVFFILFCQFLILLLDFLDLFDFDRHEIFNHGEVFLKTF